MQREETDLDSPIPIGGSRIEDYASIYGNNDWFPDTSVAVRVRMVVIVLNGIGLAMPLAANSRELKVTYPKSLLAANP